MADNLAYKLPNNHPATPSQQTGNFDNIPQELVLNRQKYQTQRELAQSKTNQNNSNIINLDQEKKKRSQVARQQDSDLQNIESYRQNDNRSPYEVDWGGAGESTNDALIEPRNQAREIKKRQENSRAAKAAQIGGKTMAATGKATKLSGKGARVAGGAAGDITGRGIGAGAGAIGGTISGAIGGALVGGVGAIPGAAAGAKAGAIKGQEIGGKIGKKIGQAPGQAMESAGKGIEKGGKAINEAGKQAETINKQMNSARKLKATFPQKLISKDPASFAAKKWSAVILTGLWSTVWLDYTLFSLAALHIYLVFTLFTNKIALFGEDYLFGRLIPDKKLAKFVELFLLAAIDAIILFAFFMTFYMVYKIYTLGWWGKAGIAWDLWWGDTGGAVEKVMKN